MGNVLADIEAVATASGQFYDFAERLNKLIAKIDSEVEVIRERGARGDAVDSMAKKYEEIRAVSMNYAHKITQVGDLLKTTAGNREGIDTSSI